MKATKRQKRLMSLILSGDGTGWFDIDTLIEVLLSSGEVASKQSLQCSIRKLEAHGVVLRDYRTRRGKQRVILVPTGKAHLWFKKP